MNECKVITLNYGTPDQPNEVVIGYILQDTVYSIPDFVPVVQKMNKEGWHFRNQSIVIQGVEYKIAGVWERETPLKATLENVPVWDQDLLNNLNQYCLPVEALGIPEDLLTYPKTQAPTPNTPIPTAQKTNEEKYLEYMTQEELNRFLPLEDLEEDQIELLESIYNSRKSQEMIKEMVKYELPKELSNYDLYYRGAVLGKVVNLEEGATQEDKDRALHEIGMAEVVKAMFNEIPRVQTADLGSQDDSAEMSFRFLGDPLRSYLKNDLAQLGNITLEILGADVFNGLTANLVKDIRTVYGSYTDFVTQYLQMEVGSEVLTPQSVTTNDGKIQKEYRIVKTYDNMLGFGVGFVSDTDKGSYLFPLALFYLVASVDSEGKFVQKYNALLDPFLKEIGKEGLNPDTLKIDSHEVQEIHCKLIGRTIDNGINVYMFQLDSEQEGYFLLYGNSIGNYMLGSYYVLIGDNFSINYKGREIVVAPTTNDVPSPEQIEQIIIAKMELDVELMSKNQRVIYEVYPGYHDTIGLNSIEEIENTKMRDICSNFHELLAKTKELGYTWNSNLTDYSSPTPTPQPVVNDVPPQAMKEEGAVDLFSSQPAGVFDNPTPTPTPTPTTPTEEYATPSELAQLSQSLTELYNRLDAKDKQRLITSIENTLEIFSM